LSKEHRFIDFRRWWLYEASDLLRAAAELRGMNLSVDKKSLRRLEESLIASLQRSYPANLKEYRATDDLSPEVAAAWSQVGKSLYSNTKGFLGDILGLGANLKAFAEIAGLSVKSMFKPVDPSQFFKVKAKRAAAIKRIKASPFYVPPPAASIHGSETGAGEDVALLTLAASPVAFGIFAALNLLLKDEGISLSDQDKGKIEDSRKKLLKSALSGGGGAAVSLLSIIPPGDLREKVAKKLKENEAGIDSLVAEAQTAFDFDDYVKTVLDRATAVNGVKFGEKLEDNIKLLKSVGINLNLTDKQKEQLKKLNEERPELLDKLRAAYLQNLLDSLKTKGQELGGVAAQSKSYKSAVSTIEGYVRSFK